MKKVLTSVKKTAPKKETQGLSLPVYDLTGKESKEIKIPREIFALSFKAPLLAQAIRVYLANQRQGTASTKTRGEVAGSTRKLYRQKGTGRARHGSIKAPIYVGGGIVFGPKPRDYALQMSQAARKKALWGALTNRFSQNKILVIKDLGKIKGKTKEVVKILEDLKVAIKHGQLKEKILFVWAKSDEASPILRAGRNIANLTFSPSLSLNPYLVLSHEKIIFSQNALESLWQKKSS
jgi:large subunit ribosomal protein L4